MAEFRLTDEERASLRRDVKINVPALERYLAEVTDRKELLLDLLKAKPTAAPTPIESGSENQRERVVFIEMKPGPHSLRHSDPRLQTLFDAIFARDPR